MPGARHDPNDAALQVGGRLPGHVLDVVVLTTDEGLLATLRDASTSEHALWPASSADAAVDLLVGGRCGVLIADLGALRGDISALIDRLHAQFPELVLLATGRREEEGAIAALLSTGVIYRFLHKPVSPARAGLFISAATRRYHELRNIDEPIALSTVRTLAAKPHIGKYAVAGVLLLIVLATWFAWRSSAPTTPIVVREANVQRTTPAEQIADLIGRAQIAFATGRLADPRGDNALEYYRAVLELQPSHEQARTGVARVIAGLERRFSDELRGGDRAAATATLGALERADPRHSRLEWMRAQLAKQPSAEATDRR